MSTTYDVTTDSSFTTDNATFDVFNGASLNLTGSSDTVIMESGSSSATLNVTGNGNTIIGSGANGIGFAMSGTGNVVTLGANAYGSDSGTGDTITLGAGSIFDVDGNNTTINATVGGSNISFVQANDGVANANNDKVTLCASSALVNGSGNQINLAWGNDTLNLNGSNNMVSFSASAGPEMIQTAAGDVVEEEAGGAISVYSGTGSYNFSINNGLVTLGFSNGNTVQISDIRFTSQGSGTVADNQVSQLVSAMASYSSGASGVSSTLMAQTPADTSLFASSHH